MRVSNKNINIFILILYIKSELWENINEMNFKFKKKITHTCMNYHTHVDLKGMVMVVTWVDISNE
jgi:hypothetical protein